MVVGIKSKKCNDKENPVMHKEAAFEKLYSDFEKLKEIFERCLHNTKRLETKGIAVCATRLRSDLQLIRKMCQEDRLIAALLRKLIREEKRSRGIKRKK